MSTLTLSDLSERLELGEQLLAGQGAMFEPQDLPGRYGRVVNAIDRVLAATGSPAALGGGWAVWRYGFFGRLTQDVDIVLPADQIDDFLQTARVSDFEVLGSPPGKWPKVLHKETGVSVDILPEGATPGTAENPAPTKIPHPNVLGAHETRVQYVLLNGLIELKLAAGRVRDEYDIVELIRANPEQLDEVRRHLAGVHSTYSSKFEDLTSRAAKQEDR